MQFNDLEQKAALPRIYGRLTSNYAHPGLHDFVIDLSVSMCIAGIQFFILDTPIWLVNWSSSYSYILG